ncbi:MAG: aminotransferase class V-fold PLP-dependent enzyme [Oscillospiraceae bacterium]
MIYLDSAATTFQKPVSVLKNVDWAMKNLGSPGRGGHRYAMMAADTAFACREKAAKLFNVKNPENVVFTFNATHGLNIAINSLVKPGMRVVTTGYEHNSVVRPLKAIGAVIDPAASELFEPEAAVSAFKQKLDKKTDVVVFNHVSNVFGYELPLYRVAELCRQKKIPLIVDASQSAGVLKIDMAALSASFIAMPGHKGLYGPQGSGILLCGSDTIPIMHGGSGSDSLSPQMPSFLPDRLEAGTHNMPGIAGLSAGLDFVAANGTERILAHEKKLITLAADGLSNIRRVKVFASSDALSQTGVLSLNIEGLPAERAGALLAKEQIAVRAGLHCAPMAHNTAGTLPDGTVRVSVSAFNSTRDIYALINAVKRIAKK